MFKSIMAVCIRFADSSLARVNIFHIFMISVHFAVKVTTLTAKLRITALNVIFILVSTYFIHKYVSVSVV